ncbi:DUF3794 domain-containing protein [Iocasia frigidifontis]|uniref:DUF3794 domain-containing protein n=1 Tax=Iocasia fonsfrigidae TaxID=2682810 RepID=A0A8A7KHA6_9FIRM|nr:DUF3794 domain-containing protein [Iocasia fonsfrigidae]QTL99465.1 DUF3794 domain-containing protein [Iocasia fonsfrigidae]
MYSWLILMGIITGFMISTYYLYQYWTKPMSEIENYFDDRVFKRVEVVPKVNKTAYEFAYQNNTNFGKDSLDKEQSNKKVHEVFAFHSIKPPDKSEKKDNEGKEGLAAGKGGNPEENNRIKEDTSDKEKILKEDRQIDDERLIKDEMESSKGVSETSKIRFESTWVSKNTKGGMIMPELQQVEGLELIKTPVVIGENVIQRMEVTDLSLDTSAIKIRDINATVTNLDTDVIDNKVIIQGTIHKQIFFVGTDDIIHHQAEDINFSYFVDVPGAEPGMDVLVEPTIEHIVTRLIMDGTILHQKVVLQFFVKVLSIQQLIVETGVGPLIKVERVIGENSVQTMVMNEVTLAVDAIKIVDINAEVVDLETEIIEDKVIIQGVVHKQLFYIGVDDVEHHQAEDIPFSEFVDIPGAEPGMNVQVHPNVEHIKQELSVDGTTVTQEIVLELFVKVTETVQINLVTGEDSLVMLPEVVGENTKQVLSETTLELDQTAIKIKDIQASFEDVNAVVINDKVIIQGIIHKQIFYVGEDNVEYHQAENVPFSTFVDVIGARPDMDVDIIPTIAFIKPELDPEGELLTQKVIGDIFVKVTENIQFNVSEVGPYGV